MRRNKRLLHPIVESLGLLLLAIGFGTLSGPRPAGAGTNLLANPGFEEVGPDGPTSSCTIDTFGGGCPTSAAAVWYVFHNNPGTTRTAIVPTDLPGGEASMIHVVTTAGRSGLVQVTGSDLYGPDTVFSVWVKVIQGRVMILLGRGEGPIVQAFSTRTGVWELVQVRNDLGEANQVDIYSDDSGAEFYVDGARLVEGMPCVDGGGPRLFLSGMVGAAAGQVVRLSAVNVNDPNIRPDPVELELALLDRHGNLLATARRSLAPGEAAFLDYPVPGAGRVAVRAAVGLVNDPGLIGDPGIIPTLEVFDRASGRTSVLSEGFLGLPQPRQ